MKHNRLWNGLTAWLCSLLISFGGTAALSTAFHFTDTRLISLFVFCFLLTGLCALTLSVKRGAVVLFCLLTAALLAAIRFLDLLAGVKTLTWLISVYYDGGYNWGVLPWGSYESMADTNIAFWLVAVIPAVSVNWAICRRKKLPVLLSLALLPLFACFVLTDTVPDVWCLTLLIAGVFLTVLTQKARQLQIPNGNRLTAMALIPVLLVSLLLPRAVPEEKFEEQMIQLQDIGKHFSFLGELFQVNANIPGATSDRVDLANSGPILDLFYTVMTIKADFSGTVYLRNRSYDNYDGRSWDTSSSGEDPAKWPSSHLTRKRGTLEISTRASENAMYLPYYPGQTSIYSDIRHGMAPNWDSVDSYSFDVMDVVDVPIAPEERIYPGWNNLPEETAIAARRILLQNNLTTVEQIIEFVQNSAEYDKGTAAMPAGESDFAIWFLEDAQTGYCVHFATAAVVLLRAAGFNARYVTGFSTSVRANRSLRVTAERAHAWVELLDEVRGWIVLDPTPAGGRPEEETVPPTTEATDPTQPSQTPTDPTESTAPTQNTTQPNQTTAPTEAPTGDREEPKAVDLSFLITLLKILALAVAIPATLWGLYCLRRRSRTKRQHTGSPNKQAIARWKEIRRIDLLLKQEPEETILTLAEKARFSQHTLRKDELALLQQALNARQQALLDKPLWLRLWLRLIWAL